MAAWCSAEEIMNVFPVSSAQCQVNIQACGTADLIQQLQAALGTEGVHHLTKDTESWERLGPLHDRKAQQLSK